MNVQILKVTPEEFSDFYQTYLWNYSTNNEHKNFYQLYESKTNAKDNPVKYFEDNGRAGSAYFFAFVDDLLVGQLSLKQSPFTENILWFTGISVDPKYQKNGIATRLIEEAFQFTKKEGKEILMSYYEEAVKEFLPDLIKLKAYDTQILIHERDEYYQYHTYGVDSNGRTIRGRFFQGEKKL